MAKSSIILELQKDAYDESSGDVTALLRKAYVVARKLKIHEFEKWINNELKGYSSHLVEIPDYRKVIGEVKAWNPYNGWIPVIIDDDKIMDMISTSKINQSIPEIEVLLKSESNILTITLSNKVQQSLSNLVDFETTFRIQFGKSQANQIVNYVRSVVLDWSLKLEEDGILGEGMSFSKEEKQSASKQNYNVYNFNGDISNSQIQQNTENSSQTMNIENINFDNVQVFLNKLKDNLDGLNLDEENKRVMDSEIKTITAQLESPRPRVGALSEAFYSIRNILEGVVGSLLASGLLYELGQLIS